MVYPARIGLIVVLAVTPLAAQEVSNRSVVLTEVAAPEDAPVAPEAVSLTSTATPTPNAESVATPAPTPAPLSDRVAVPDSALVPDPTPPSPSILPEKPAPQSRLDQVGDFVVRPFLDKRIRLLAEVNAGAAAMDDTTSRLVIEEGGYERNPFMRPFVHDSAALAFESVGEVWLMSFLAEKMKESHYHILRKAWWLPQSLNIAAKLSGGIYNSTLLAQ